MIRKNSQILRHENTLFIAVITLCLSIFPQFVIAGKPIPVKNIKHLFSIKGSKTSPLSLPSDVAIDRDGNIYVVDSGNHRIAVFDDGGNNVSHISAKGNHKNEMLNPVGIDVSGDKIYVADKDNHRIQVFGTNGEHIKTIPTLLGKTLIRPVDVAVNPKSKLLFVSGNNNHKLMVYNYSGKLHHQWGGEGTNKGEFRFPATISLYQNNAYVVDVLNSRVQIFDKKGILQAITGEWGVLPGQLFRPKGVTHDAKGNIYVSDSYMGMIQVFTNDTYFKHVLGAKQKPYVFTSPAGITIDSKNRLYVCEMLDNKVSVFSLEP